MELSRIFFLRQDLDDLQSAIESLRAEIRRVKAESAEATEQSSETWHDNFTFEEAQRQLRMLLNQLAGLSRALERAEVVEPPADPVKADVGTLVRLRDLDSGEFDVVVLASAMVGRRLSELGCVSYQSPLGALLYGAVSGQERTGRVGSRERRVLVLAVEAVPFLS
jgi:transcription elongation GreA/GreB family factor